ncbi:ABC transporter permease [Litoribrevibacter euphylliae]|uniref:ABC transporter permease n=1 Tax=Litoribrevibacter euphylliae TaxID=1834034 RepID=A0ABV7HJ37_9GAMM
MDHLSPKTPEQLTTGRAFAFKKLLDNPVSQWVSKKRWWLLVIAIALTVFMPVAVIFLSWLSPQPEDWTHLLDTVLSELLVNTLLLALGVALGVLILGVALAWLTAMCQFPGRKFFDWALMLPFSVPAYVMAFCFLGLLDYSGPIQTWLRTYISPDFDLPVRNLAGVICVFVLAFYPYVYMLARTAFMNQGRGQMDAARSLGCNSYQAFWRVMLPMARPAIAAGMALAIMETLADFGAVSVFNFDTFTTAIYKSWYGLFNIYVAAQLASVLLVFVIACLWMEQKARGKARFEQHERQQKQSLYLLSGAQAAMASAFCTLILSLAFVLPVSQLVWWVIETQLADFDARFVQLMVNTVSLGGIAALMTVFAALIMAFAQRVEKNPVMDQMARFSTLGYALPGTVLAVGLMVWFSWLDNSLIQVINQVFGINTGQLFLGSVFALLVSYVVRFLAVAYGPVNSHLQAVRITIHEAAQSLGATQRQVLWRVYVPMLRPGLLVAGLLVLVDVMKEMPATLLMRPFGWDTLAVRIYEMTSEGEWERAALPALTLVIVGLAPVIVLMSRSRRH